MGDKRERKLNKLIDDFCNSVADEYHRVTGIALDILPNNGKVQRETVELLTDWIQREFRKRYAQLADDWMLYIGEELRKHEQKLTSGAIGGDKNKKRLKKIKEPEYEDIVSVYKKLRESGESHPKAIEQLSERTGKSQRRIRDIVPKQK